MELQTEIIEKPIEFLMTSCHENIISYGSSALGTILREGDVHETLSCTSPSYTTPEHQALIDAAIRGDVSLLKTHLKNGYKTLYSSALFRIVRDKENANELLNLIWSYDRGYAEHCWDNYLEFYGTSVGAAMSAICLKYVSLNWVLYGCLKRSLNIQKNTIGMELLQYLKQECDLIDFVVHVKQNIPELYFEQEIRDAACSKLLHDACVYRLFQLAEKFLQIGVKPSLSTQLLAEEREREEGGMNDGNHSSLLSLLEKYE